jgi:hypothetical protein
MISDLTGLDAFSGENLATVSASFDAVAFYPPRHVTGALLQKMGFEFIRPDQIKSQWKIIHKEKPFDAYD